MLWDVSIFQVSKPFMSHQFSFKMYILTLQVYAKQGVCHQKFDKTCNFLGQNKSCGQNGDVVEFF